MLKFSTIFELLLVEHVHQNKRTINYSKHLCCPMPALLYYCCRTWSCWSNSWAPMKWTHTRHTKPVSSVACRTRITLINCQQWLRLMNPSPMMLSSLVTQYLVSGSYSVMRAGWLFLFQYILVNLCVDQFSPLLVTARRNYGTWKHPVTLVTNN